MRTRRVVVADASLRSAGPFGFAQGSSRGGRPHMLLGGPR